jgi:hypothetical protein
MSRRRAASVKKAGSFWLKVISGFHDFSKFGQIPNKKIKEFSLVFIAEVF